MPLTLSPDMQLLLLACIFMGMSMLMIGLMAARPPCRICGAAGKTGICEDCKREDDA